jgi:hypothetical protein
MMNIAAMRPADTLRGSLHRSGRNGGEDAPFVTRGTGMSHRTVELASA